MSRRPAYLASAISIGVATGVYGASFGVLAVGAGLSAVQACVMSILVFTGGSQFAAIGVIGSGGSPATAVGSALLLGVRNTAYGLSMAPLLPKDRVRRALASHLAIDESVAMARAQSNPDDARGAFLATGLSVFVLWNLGTLVGALAGGQLDPKDYGLDAMFPAAFLALVAPQLRQRDAPAAALLGALIAVVLVPITPAGIPVIAASLGLVVALRRGSSSGATPLTDAAEPSPVSGNRSPGGPTGGAAARDAGGSKGAPSRGGEAP